MDDISQLEFKNMDGKMGKAGKASFLAVGERERREVEKWNIILFRTFQWESFFIFSYFEIFIKITSLKMVGWCISRPKFLLRFMAILKCLSAVATPTLALKIVTTFETNGTGQYSTFSLIKCFTKEFFLFWKEICSSILCINGKMKWYYFSSPEKWYFM